MEFVVRKPHAWLASPVTAITKVRRNCGAVLGGPLVTKTRRRSLFFKELPRKPPKLVRSSSRPFAGPPPVSGLLRPLETIPFLSMDREESRLALSRSGYIYIRGFIFFRRSRCLADPPFQSRSGAKSPLKAAIGVQSVGRVVLLSSLISFLGTAADSTCRRISFIFAQTAINEQILITGEKSLYAPTSRILRLSDTLLQKKGR